MESVFFFLTIEIQVQEEELQKESVFLFLIQNRENLCSKILLFFPSFFLKFLRFIDLGASFHLVNSLIHHLKTFEKKKLIFKFRNHLSKNLRPFQQHHDKSGYQSWSGSRRGDEVLRPFQQHH